MRVFTCTPIRFKGDHTFFARDSGLLSVGLSMNGLESRPVTPGPPMPDDDPRLIRANYHNLSDPAWWRSQRVDAVVFFSWAMPAYTPIAKAIKASGAKLLVFLDAAGYWSPRSEGVDWARTQLRGQIRKRGLALGTLRFGVSFFRSIFPALFDRPRLEHMVIADLVTVTSPMVLERTKHYAAVYGYGSLSAKINCLPLPVSPYMRYGGQEKRKRVISVARWLRQDWPEKGPQLLLGALDSFLSRRPDYEALVVGRGASELRESDFYPRSLEDKTFTTINYLPNYELVPLLANTRISLCSSFHESFHIASFEAACCGCSVVALQSPDLPALQFLADTNGTLARKEAPEAFSDALVKEASNWDEGLRRPALTSQQWQAETHADKVAARAITLLGL
jgi:glycosyltransferase involved in cell wall biosynthesis